jgi:sensor histidine kinase YesM
MKHKKKIRFRLFVLLVSLIFGLLVIIFVGTYLYTRVGKTFDEMITTMEDNNFQQSIIGLNGFYIQSYNTATFLQNNMSFLNMLTRFIELNPGKNSSQFSPDEINERYKLQDNIEEFIHKIVIQNRILSLHYGKPDNLLYKEIAIFMENSILSAENVVTKADTNIFFNTEKKDDTINFLSYDQLKEYGIKLTEGHSRSDPIGINENPPCVLFNIIQDNIKICSILIVLNNTYIEQNVHSSDNIIVINKDNCILFQGKNIDKSISDNLIGRKEYENKLKIDDKNNKYIIRESILNIGELYLYHSVNASSYDLIKIKQALFLVLSITINLILIIVISQYQAKKIISPVNKLNQAISAFPERDMGLELKDETDNKYKKAISLHERLIRYFIVTTVIPFVLFICACYITSMIELRTYITDYSDSIVGTEARTVSKTIERKTKSFFMFINEPYVLKVMMHENDMHENDIMEDIRAALDKGVFMGIGKSRVMLIDTSGEVLAYNNATVIDNLKKTSKISENTDSYESFFPIKWKIDRNLLEEFTLILDVPVFYKQALNDMKFVGTAAIFIDMWEIEKIFYRSNITDRKVYLIDHKGKVFDVYNKAYLPEDKNATIKALELDSKYGMHIVKDVEGLDWQVISVFSKDYVDSKTNLLKRDCIYCMFLVILLSIVYSFFVSYHILKPINQVNYYINTVELDSAGDINIDEFYIDEIDKIGKSFIMMTERIEQLIDELMLSQYNNLVLDKKGRKAQIKALQAEITPHFLYNTLDIIINLIRDMKTEKAITMIQALSDLFRYSITDNEISSITIGEELRYAESYANILTVHYNEHVHFNWEIEPDIEQYECMRMFLQPLIENCVIHALNENDLEVIIKCKLSGEEIIFTVEDNGRGIDEIELNRLRNRIRAGDSHYAHIGLNNVNSRL